MHEQIIPKLVEKSDPIYNGKFILRIPVILKDGDGNIIDDRASIDVPFKYDSRFVSAKVSEIQHT